MARRKKDAEAEAPAPDAEEQQAAAGKQIGARAFRALLKSCRQSKSEIEEISGAMGAEVKDAVEKFGLNRKAFGWIRQLDRMPPEKLAIFLDDFEHYLKISGLTRRAESAPSFDVDGGAEEEDSGNVVAYPGQGEARH